MPHTPYRARRYLTPEIDLDDWSQLEPFFTELLERRPDSAAALEEWITECDELTAAVAESGAWKYIRMTCQTDDDERREAYYHFIREIEPRLKPLLFEFQKLYLANPHLEELDPIRFEVYNRSTRTAVELFREENIPLQTEVEEQSQQYGRILGGMTVDFRGEEKTLQQMTIFLKDADRDTRREAWILTAQRRLQDRAELDELFDSLLQLRHQIARNAGCDDFRAYRWRTGGRFDYTPADCLRFHEVIEETVLPLVVEQRRLRREVLGLAELRPWDLSVDLFLERPLRPFERSEELVEGVIDIFDRLHEGLGDKLREMRRLEHLDLDNRKGKAPGGYNCPLPETGVPFIFMNAIGLHRDLTTMIHEGGHAVHSFLARDLALLEYRHTPAEVSELASMSMELLALPHLERFYADERDRDLAVYQQFNGILELLPWVAAVDAFQHWIYTNPEHSPGERTERWQELVERYLVPEVDWSGREEVLRTLWHRQLHIFEMPFYYIEYAIAQLGALQIWRNHARDGREAITAYLRALAMGYSRPIPEIYRNAGITFDFSPEVVGELMTAVGEQLREVTERLRG